MPPKIPNFMIDEESEVSNSIEDIDINSPKKTIEVETPSGATISLLSEAEVGFYQKISARYQEDNKFTNISDLLELDRVLTFEVLCFRLSTWVMQDADYDGNLLPKDIQKNIKELSREIRDIKTGLGIDKKTRDAGQGETFNDKWQNILFRAKEFGYHRNEQMIKSHTLWKELQGKITFYRNSTDTEKTEFDMHAEDIFRWLEEKFEEFDAIDEAFREEQKIWIREIN